MSCVLTACGPVCHSGYQDHRKYYVGHSAATVHVRCHRRAVIQGKVSSLVITHLKNLQKVDKLFNPRGILTYVFLREIFSAILESRIESFCREYYREFCFTYFSSNI